MRFARFRSQFMALSAVIAGISALSPIAPAATLYWDGDGTGATGNPPAPSANVGGTGTWNSSNLNWWNGTTYQSWTSAGGEDIADFRGPAGVVTISGTINVNRLIFTEDNNWLLTGGTINLTGVATIQRVTNNQFFESNITGSNGLTFVGGGIQVFLGTPKTYSGNTTMGGNNLRLLVNDVLPVTTTLIFPGGSIDARSANQQLAGIESLSGAGTYGRQTAGTHTLTLNRVSGTSSFGGVFNPNPGAFINLVKSGGYTQVLTGTTNNLTTNVNVQNGTLALAKTAGVDALGSGAISITGGTLRLDADNQINDAADLSLSGGTFNLNGNDETLDALTLTADSVIDFGSVAGSNILAFTSGSRTGGQLNILNWVGNPGIGGGTDQLRFTAAPDAAFLANVRFVGYHPNAIAVNQGSFFEVVPIIPEPASVALLTLGVALIARRRDR